MRSSTRGCALRARRQLLFIVALIQSAEDETRAKMLGVPVVAHFTLQLTTPT
jgi:hypothetical protein